MPQKQVSHFCSDKSDGRRMTSDVARRPETSANLLDVQGAKAGPGPRQIIWA